MMGERKPDETFNIEVDGFNVVAYSFGQGDEVLFRSEEHTSELQSRQ